MTEPRPPPARSSLKRPRPVLSCMECRRKKLRCDRLLPCQQCLKIDHPSSCTYAPGQEPEIRSQAQILDHGTPKRARHSAVIASPTPSSSIVQGDNDQIAELNERVKRLEYALSNNQHVPQTAATTPRDEPVTPSVTRRSEVGEASNAEDEVHEVAGEYTSIFSRVCVCNLSRPIEVVTWSTLLEVLTYYQFEHYHDFVTMLKHQIHNPKVQGISTQLRKLVHVVARPTPFKTLPRAVGRDLDGDIDALALLQEPRSGVLSQLRQLLPPMHVCNVLVDLYFENFEHCARVLHKPCFLEDYKSYAMGDLEPRRLDYFVPSLIGIVCIASNLNTFPECDIPSLNGSTGAKSVFRLLDAWYNWILERDGHTMTAIQVRLLTIQAQKHRELDLVNLWVSSAQLVRHAMLCKLHKAADSRTNNYEVEMRRGIWLTILEQDLALSIICEMAPMTPSYDLKPPTNCNDAELSETSTADAPEHPIHVWTDGLCQHILGLTFNQRLEAYRHCFQLPNRSVTNKQHYHEMIEHARKLEAVLRSLPAQFRLDDATSTPGRLMAQMELDITLRRPLIAAYTPYARLDTMRDKEYRDVRIPWVQSNLVVMCFQDLFDPLYPSIDVPRPIGYWDFYHTTYRYDVIKSMEAMLLEAQHLQRFESQFASRPRSVAQRESQDTEHRRRGVEGRATSHSSSPSSPDGGAHASSVPFMSWGFSAMMKSVEDSLGPMSRRIGASGEDVCVIARYTLLWESMRAPAESEENRQAVLEYMLNSLQRMVTTLRTRLEREGYSFDESHYDWEREMRHYENVGWLINLI